MNEIMSKVRTAGRRLVMNQAVSALVMSATAAVGTLAVLRLVQQTFGFSLQWNTLALGATGVVGAATLAWAIATRPSHAKAARELDERADLRESLSTALSLPKSNEPWAQLVLQTATERAATVDVRRSIPIELPRRWFWPMAAGLALFASFCVPMWDVLGTHGQRLQEAEKKLELIEVKQEIKDNQKKLDELLAKVAPDLKNEQANPDTPEANQPEPASQKPEELRVAEMKRLTDLADRLAAAANGEKGMQLQAMQQMTAQLKHPGDSPLNDMFNNLAKADFGKAQQSLNQLKDKVAAGNLSAEEKKKLAEALNKLGEQLAKQGDPSKDMAKALEQNGMDAKKAAEMAKQLAANPDMIKKAMEALKNLTPEQREQLAKKLEAQCKASKSASKGSKACQNASQACESGNMSEMSDSLSEMSEMMSENEMLQQTAKELQAALSECQSQMECMGESMCNGAGKGKGKPGKYAWSQQEGEWKEGDSDGFGKNGKGGGPGKGFGDRSGSTATDFTTDRQKLKLKTGKGQIIGRQYVKGEQIVGESFAEYAEAVEAAGQSAAEALESGEVPPELRGTVRAYFTKMKETAKPAEATTPANKPAEEKK